MTEECLPRDEEENKNEKEIKLMEFFLSATHDLRGPLGMPVIAFGMM